MSCTGYTADVVNGTITDFRAFALRCARAFGALIDMRDDPLDAEIPETFTPHTSYYDGAISLLKPKLESIRAMSAAECLHEQQRIVDEITDRNQQHRKEAEIEDARVAAMAASVRNWTPPTTEHEGLKNFMLEQLQMSGGAFYETPVPLIVSAEEWRSVRIAALEAEISWHEKARREEMDRSAGRTEWLKQLRTSLQKQEA